MKKIAEGDASTRVFPFLYRTDPISSGSIAGGLHRGCTKERKNTLVSRYTRALERDLREFSRRSPDWGWEAEEQPGIGEYGDALDCNLDRRVETLMISCAAKSVFPLNRGNVINSRNGVTQFQRSSCLSGVEFITYGRIIMDTGVNDTSIYTTPADV